MKIILLLLCGLSIFSCSNNIKIEDTLFDNLRGFNKEDNTWLKTRIYPNSFIDDDNDFSRLRGSDSSIALYSEFFFHTLGTNDDQYWQKIVFVIHDTSKLRIDSVYQIPNDLIHISMRNGGPYNGHNEVFNINGFIKFEYLTIDSSLVKTNLRGQRYFEGKL